MVGVQTRLPPIHRPDFWLLERDRKWERHRGREGVRGEMLGRVLYCVGWCGGRGEG